MPLALCAARRRVVEEQKPKIVFLTSPNNPDGSMMSEEEVGGAGRGCWVLRMAESCNQLWIGAHQRRAAVHQAHTSFMMTPLF